jgi:hypothetical protein
MPVVEAQHRISSTEFVQWRHYLEDEPNHFNPLFYYLAQIAMEVRASRMFSKSKKSLNLKQFMISFTKKNTNLVTDPKKTKGIWLSWLGVEKD